MPRERHLCELSMGAKAWGDWDDSHGKTILNADAQPFSRPPVASTLGMGCTITNLAGAAWHFGRRISSRCRGRARTACHGTRSRIGGLKSMVRCSKEKSPAAGIPAGRAEASSIREPPVSQDHHSSTSSPTGTIFSSPCGTMARTLGQLRGEVIEGEMLQGSGRRDRRRQPPRSSFSSDGRLLKNRKIRRPIESSSILR